MTFKLDNPKVYARVFDAQFKNNKRQVNEGLASINDEVEDYVPPGWRIRSAEVEMFVEEIAYKSRRKTTSFGKELCRSDGRALVWRHYAGNRLKTSEILVSAV